MPRFKPGQVVRLKSYRMGHRFHLDKPVRVVLVHEEGHLGCMYCDDPECVEWANALGEDGRWYVHVSECEMEKDDQWE